jgi:putative copper resistance protein D
VNAPSLSSLVVSHWRSSGVPDLGVAAAAVLYLCGTLRVRGRWPVRRTACFLAGLASVVVALDSGIGAYDDQLLSVHMVQHMLLLLVAPLLLLAGRPVILALRSLPARERRAAAALLYRLAAVTRPVVCLAVFCLVLVLTHLPAFYDSTLRHPAVHDAEHALYLLAGLMLWWPLLDADPVPAHRLAGLGRLVYLLATMPPMAIVGAYLNRHPTLVYPAYAAPAHSMGISAVVDQQQAGAIMWVAGSVIVIAVGLWMAIAALVAEERRQQAREARAFGGSVL